MELAKGADAYRISNPPLLLAAALTVSLDIVKSCGGMHRLRENPLALPNNQYQLVTPSNPSERGAQLTLSFTFANVEKVYENLLQLGAICDYRKPSFLRISPIPLYNSFEDVYLFVKCLRQTFNNTTN
nr:unnamed protein product [Trichobilharzia regenti]